VDRVDDLLCSGYWGASRKIKGKMKEIGGEVDLLHCETSEKAGQEKVRGEGND